MKIAADIFCFGHPSKPYHGFEIRELMVKIIFVKQSISVLSENQKDNDTRGGYVMPIIDEKSSVLDKDR